jgi:hypothetical protein
MRLPNLLCLLLGQDEMMLQDPEALMILSVDFPHEGLRPMGLGHVQVLGPDDVLGETRLGAEDRVEDEAVGLFVVDGGVEGLEVRVGDQEMLQFVYPDQH